MTATAAPTTLLNVSTSGSLVAGTEADYRRLEQEVAAHCPVLDNLTHGVPVTTTVEVPAA